MKTKKIIMIIAVILVVVFIAWLCVGYFQKLFVKTQNPIATMEIEGYGTVKIELYPDMAPNTVANFICLANRGFYNGLTFHRVVSGFMIQGGDANGDGTGSPSLSDIKDDVDDDDDETYSIEGEFSANGFSQNTLRHEEGVISMARSDYSYYGLTTQGYNSAGSQFFIMTANNSSLNGLYAAFGKVIEGMDIVHQIENLEVVTDDDDDSGETPVDPPVITSITVETYGVDYGTPEVQETFDIQSYIMSQYLTYLQ
jgi:peptidyl-prolyl cis-trans isomerase B (cyclophilin B)